MNKTLIFIVTIIISILNSCYANNKDEFLLGSWVLSSDYEFPDVLIFRTDYKYFVYNSSSVSPESLGRSENLDNGDILINEAYTSLTESGNWRYDYKSKELVLYDREIMKNWTDFSDAYGRDEVLTFKVDRKAENALEFCLEVNQEQLCDTYEKNWSYKKNEVKIFYHEISVAFSGDSDFDKNIVLSGYETELKLTFNLTSGESEIVLLDNKNLQIFFDKAKSSDKIQEILLPLKGVTNLTVSVRPYKRDTKWNLKIELK